MTFTGNNKSELIGSRERSRKNVDSRDEASASRVEQEPKVRTNRRVREKGVRRRMYVCVCEKERERERDVAGGY